MKLPYTKTSRQPNRRAGFSLAELMVVIVILGLLAGLVLPKVMDKLSFSQVGTAKVELTTIASAVTEFALRNGGRHPGWW